MAVSIRDVAKEAGVSVSTVSRALNGYTDVNEKTKKKIQDTVQMLGYTPNQSAKNLSSKSQKNMALLVSGMAYESRLNEFTGNMLRGVSTYINGAGKTVAMYVIDSGIQKEKSLEDFCNEYSLSGVMLLGLKLQDAYFKQAEQIELPCVGVDISLNGINTATINTDDTKAFEEITDYVLDRKHKKLVLIKGRQTAQVTYMRQKGFENSLEKHGIAREAVTAFDCDFQESAAYSSTKQYIKENGATEATAFICMSDLMALGVIRAIKECGYSVPDDFSVTGFDGMFTLNYIIPGITTVDQDVVRKGYEGIKLLTDILDGKKVPHNLNVPHKFIERDSVKELSI